MGRGLGGGVRAGGWGEGEGWHRAAHREHDRPRLVVDGEQVARPVRRPGPIARHELRRRQVLERLLVSVGLRGGVGVTANALVLAAERRLSLGSG